MRRLMIADELPWMNAGPRGVMRALDLGWKVPRSLLWLTTVPWSMFVTGVKGPGAWRKGHRGPVRRAIGRSLAEFARRRDAIDGLDELHAAADDAHGSLRGRVRVREAVDGGTGPAAWVRIDAVVETVSDFTERWHVVYEAGNDFDLEVDAARDAVRVLARDGYLVAARGAEQTNDERWLQGVALPERMAGLSPRLLHARRRWLVDGDLVQVIGAKTRLVDPTVEAERLERDAPTRMALGASTGRPLLLFPESK